MYVQFNRDTRDMKISFLVLVLGITTIFGLNIKPKIEPNEEETEIPQDNTKTVIVKSVQ